MTILERILRTKRKEVERAKRERPFGELRAAAEGADPPRDFFQAVAPRSGGEVALIAEIKKASPSAGLLVKDFDPVAIARTYARCGAAALSVLTDETYFQGQLDFILAVKRAAPLPVLRKDFLIDEYQVYEARAGGADAALLIAEALSMQELTALWSTCRQLGMTPLIEVHHGENLNRLLQAIGTPGESTYLLGINHRDLAAQTTDLNVSVRLSKRLPPGAPWIAESGIRTREDVLGVQKAGACAILVGESLLRSPDVAAHIDELMGRLPIE